MSRISRAAGTALALIACSVVGPAWSQGSRLTLVNGWKVADGAAKPSVFLSKGIVTLKGAITGGGGDLLFVLPQTFRPAALVYVTVDLCKSRNGRLYIYPDGNTYVEAEGDLADAECFTSLDGASFAASADSYKPLKLKNGWYAYQNQTAPPAVRLIDGIAHFEGAIGTSKTNGVAFRLPIKFRASTNIYVPLDLCDATVGRVYINVDGYAEIEDEASDFSNAKCFTSLDGAHFAVDTTGYTALTLLNGWKNAPYSTRNAAVKLINNVVHFAGAISNGSTATAFVLPPGFRPANDVYVPVDLTSTSNGRLHIYPDGTVKVQAQTDFASAQDFTSLEGVSFHL